MSDSAIAGSVHEAAHRGTRAPFYSILYSGLVVGVLDILDAKADGRNNGSPT